MQSEFGDGLTVTDIVDKNFKKQSWDPYLPNSYICSDEQPAVPIPHDPKLQNSMPQQLAQAGIRPSSDNAESTFVNAKESAKSTGNIAKYNKMENAYKQNRLTMPSISLWHDKSQPEGYIAANIASLFRNMLLPKTPETYANAQIPSGVQPVVFGEENSEMRQYADYIDNDVYNNSKVKVTPPTADYYEQPYNHLHFDNRGTEYLNVLAGIRQPIWNYDGDKVRNTIKKEDLTYNYGAYENMARNYGYADQDDYIKASAIPERYWKKAKHYNEFMDNASYNFKPSITMPVEKNNYDYSFADNDLRRGLKEPSQPYPLYNIIGNTSIDNDQPGIARFYVQGNTAHLYINTKFIRNRIPWMKDIDIPDDVLVNLGVGILNHISQGSGDKVKKGYDWAKGYLLQYLMQKDNSKTVSERALNAATEKMVSDLAYVYDTATKTSEVRDAQINVPAVDKDLKKTSESTPKNKTKK